MTTYASEIKELMNVCDVDSTIYLRQPVREGGQIRRLTTKQRREVEKVSTERGYRRFVAEMMTTI
ncbi:MAG: hypothetical protein GXX84_10185 [Acidobacteria bacterium]|nr:hypothetical protein [Acidobacteriota bacterium]